MLWKTNLQNLIKTKKCYQNNIRRIFLWFMTKQFNHLLNFLIKLQKTKSITLNHLMFNNLREKP